MFKLLIVPLQINIAASETVCGLKETILDENRSKLVDASLVSGWPLTSSIQTPSESINWSVRLHDEDALETAAVLSEPQIVRCLYLIPTCGWANQAADRRSDCVGDGPGPCK